MKIKKYELKFTDKQNINVGGNNPMPLSVHEINGKLMMFVQLEEDYPGSFNIDVDIAETGEQYEIQGKFSKFVGTAVMSSGKELHVFTRVNYARGDI